MIHLKQDILSEILEITKIQIYFPQKVQRNFFDAIFIDAKKTEYPQYLREAKNRLNPGGLIIADNTLMVNHEQMPEISDAINEFNNLIKSDKEFTSVIIPTKSGMTVAIKN